MARLVSEQVPLTMCPISNRQLQVFPDLRDHNLKRLLDAGVKVTINSDDPAYFGGYIAQNYLETAEALGARPQERQRQQADRGQCESERDHDVSLSSHRWT